MFCPQCGAPNDDDSVYCGNCGAVLDPGAEPFEASEQPVVEEPVAESEALSAESALDVAPEKEPVPYEPSATYVQPASPAPTSGMAIVALILGISGLTVFPFLGSILALIFGYMARNEIRRRPDELGGKGLAVAGIVTGWIGVALTVAGILAMGGILLCSLFSVFGASTGY